MTGRVDADELAMRSDDECPIVNGQYRIVPNGGTKPVLHRRVTNFIKPLADMYLVELSNQRKVAVGLAANPGLFALVVAAHPDDRQALNTYCEKAKIAAKAGDRADLGTALHTMTERVDRGENPDSFPEPYRSDLLAYRATMDAAGIEILHIEQHIVVPDLKVAGRCDRIVSFGSKPQIADIKTGSLDFGMGPNAAQLALYANGATFYDPKTQTHTPMPDVDKDIGLIIHLPAGQGVCTLHFVDIRAGWEAVQHADWIHQWRKRKDLSDPWQPGARFDALIERRAGIVARLETLRDTHPEAFGELAAQWPAGIPTLKQSQAHSPDDLTAIDNVLVAVEDRHQVPFGPTDPNHNHILKGASA